VRWTGAGADFRLRCRSPDLLLRRGHLCRDPISYFAIETQDYSTLARRIASLGLPTLIVMEGGYAVDALGANIEAFLSGF
jgi:hypothetical protein